MTWPADQALVCTRAEGRKVVTMAGQESVTFGALLRRLRTEAGLTQEGLAEAAGLSPRSVSDLERGINQTARRETTRLLADALALAGPPRAEFETAARGRALAGSVAGGGAAATQTLPRDVGSFTGREAELRELLAAAADAGGVVGIHAIGGMAGIGKTAFAVHAAHELASQFPDGQIFLPLYGHTPGHHPVDPADALVSLLLTSGVAAQQIPAGLEARMALWRDHLAGKQLLLLLDDAADSEQVGPLLPGTAGNLVLVTSRRHLTALEDAHAISLDVLTADEAAGLLIRLAARPGLHREDPAVAEITRLCGCLPLAIGMLARQLHHHPAWTAEDLAADLAASRDRLELMHTENLSVAAAFDLSYADLRADQQRLFRRLGLHPGTDIDAYAAAALDDIDPGTARRQLGALYDQYLLTEPARDRYRMHDLIREHARALAARDDPARQREEAIQRLLDYYLYTALAVGDHLTRRTPAVLPARTGVPPAYAPDLATRADAVTWMDDERLILHALADHAAVHGQPLRATAIAAAMHDYLRVRGHWDQALTLHQTAVAATQQGGDRLAEAGALTDLGEVEYLTANFPAATQHLSRALGLYRDMGNRIGEAGVLYHLGSVQRQTGDYAAGMAGLSRALGLYRDLGSRIGEANALNYLGVLQYLTGDNTAATTSLSRALTTYRDLGYPRGEVDVLTHLGAVQMAMGDHTAASSTSERAVEISRAMGNRIAEGNALMHLGAAQQAAGHYSASRVTLTRALELFRDLGARDGVAEVLNVMGALALASAAHSDALACHQRALEIAADIQLPLEEARALEGIGRCYLQAGQPERAAAPSREALTIYERIGSPHARRVATLLHGLRI